MQVTQANFSTENIKWDTAAVGMQTCTPEWSRMADKLSKERNSSTFKNVSVDNGVIGMQGKATETRKNVILTTETKQKHTVKSH